MDSDRLRIAGLTGVDVSLDVAGPGSRSYAFVIDWHIRLLLALAWFLLLAYSLWGLGMAGRPWSSLPSIIARAALLPALGIYFFYHPVLEVLMRGRTPGKRMAGVRIVARNGGTPSVGALIIRNLLRLIDSLPAFYLVGLITCFVTAQRVRIGDLAAGTILVIDDVASAKSLGKLGTLIAQSGLPHDMVELIDDLLKRWSSLETRNRDALARSILTRLDASMTAEMLGSLSDVELHRRLRTSLRARPGPAA